MKQLVLPKDYKSVLDVWQTERAIKFIKDTFQYALSTELKLRRITAPIVVKANTGLNDNLNGSENPVCFNLSKENNQKVEIVQSLAKWKRYALWRHNIEPGMGIYTDMNAIRADEVTDNTHSIYVDQWDWEKVIKISDRTVDYLEKTVRGIYKSMKYTEYLVSEQYPVLKPFLPENIHFIHTEQLRKMYPDLTPKERENAITRKYGAVFIRGIGGNLDDGCIHDERSPDYDDWSTINEDGSKGLNGDILIWNPVLDSAFEISSMGIRVNCKSLDYQLKNRNCEDRRELYYHKLLLDGKLPQTIGGGIGQSRLCMLFLKKCHIGEVQAGIWSQEDIDLMEEAGIFLY